MAALTGKAPSKYEELFALLEEAQAAALSLKRGDLAGKTGTTNDYVDAWFCGYQPSAVGIAWIGFDQPKKLGNGETGGFAALPIWIGYMGKAAMWNDLSRGATVDDIVATGKEIAREKKLVLAEERAHVGDRSEAAVDGKRDARRTAAAAHRRASDPPLRPHRSRRS